LRSNTPILSAAETSIDVEVECIVSFTIISDYDFDEDPPYCCPNDTYLWWHEPCNHTQDRDYVKVMVTANRDLDSGDEVVLHFDKDKIQVAPEDNDSGDSWGFASTNGLEDNVNGTVTFSGPLTAGNEFYAVFWKVGHDWGSGAYENIDDTLLTLSSNLNCPDYPADFYILFDDDGPVRSIRR